MAKTLRSSVLLLLAVFGAHQTVFCGPVITGRWLDRRDRTISLRAQEADDDTAVPAWRAGLAGRKGALGILGGILLVTAYLFTKGPEARYAKLCVRSKQMEKDFFNDPKKAEWARSKGYKALQDPDCKEWPEFWEAVKPF